jgi:hypothetical protein
MADRFFQVAVHYTVGGQHMESTFCIFGDDSDLDFTPMNAQGLADKLGGNADFTTAWKNLLVASDALDDVTVRELVAPGGSDIPSEGSHHVGLSGTRSFGGSALPLEVCAILGIHTDAAIRSGRGYFHLPPARSTTTMNGSTADQFNLSDAYWTAANALLAEMGHWNNGGSHWDTGSSWGVGVYSRTRRARGISTFAFHAVSYSLPNSVKWLRSRKP